MVLEAGIKRGGASRRGPQAFCGVASVVEDRLEVAHLASRAWMCAQGRGVE